MHCTSVSHYNGCRITLDLRIRQHCQRTVKGLFHVIDFRLLVVNKIDPVAAQRLGRIIIQQALIDVFERNIARVQLTVSNACCVAAKHRDRTPVSSSIRTINYAC